MAKALLHPWWLADGASPSWVWVAVLVTLAALCLSFLAALIGWLFA